MGLSYGFLARLPGALACAGLALAAMVVLVGTAAAQFKADSEAPIEITADTMEWFQDQQVAVAKGNADAVQGRYHLHADELKAFMAGGENDAIGDIRRIDAEGNVVLTTPEETARGRSGIYDLERGVAVLIGDVVLTQGENVMRGEQLIMDLETGRSRLEGDAVLGQEQVGGGRVRAIFGPSQRNPDGGE